MIRPIDVSCSACYAGAGVRCRGGHQHPARRHEASRRRAIRARWAWRGVGSAVDSLARCLIWTHCGEWKRAAYAAAFADEVIDAAYADLEEATGWMPANSTADPQRREDETS